MASIASAGFYPSATKAMEKDGALWRFAKPNT